MGYTLILGVFLCIISLRGFYGLKNPKCIITAKKPKYYCRYMKIRPNSMKTLKIQLPMEKMSAYAPGGDFISLARMCGG